MNKTRVKPPSTSSGGILPGQSGVAASSTRQSSNRCRPIVVRDFEDSRLLDSSSPNPVLPDSGEIASLDATGSWVPGSRRVTRLFSDALQHAGHEVAMSLAGTDEGPAGLGSAVLEGRIWRFHFQTHATTILEVDLSLALRDPRTSAVLWQCEFPGEEVMPFWIGLGCRSEVMVEMALNEVQGTAFLEFSSDQFLEALRREKAVVKPASAESDGSHEVVAGSSWTGTDEGEITATAHESRPSAPVGVSSLKDPDQPAPDRLTNNPRRSAQRVGSV